MKRKPYFAKGTPYPPYELVRVYSHAFVFRPQQQEKHPAQQAGTVQKRILRRAKKTPQPTRLGPINFSSRVWKPLSPIPTKVMMRPIQTIPRPT